MKDKGQSFQRSKQMSLEDALYDRSMKQFGLKCQCVMKRRSEIHQAPLMRVVPVNGLEYVLKFTVLVFAVLVVFAFEDQNEWIGISDIPFPRSVGSFDVIELAGWLAGRVNC